MIHLSIRNPLERDKEIRKLKAKKYVYHIHYSGLHDKDILNPKKRRSHNWQTKFSSNVFA